MTTTGYFAQYYGTRITNISSPAVNGQVETLGAHDLKTGDQIIIQYVRGVTNVMEDGQLFRFLSISQRRLWNSLDSSSHCCLNTRPSSRIAYVNSRIAFNWLSWCRMSALDSDRTQKKTGNTHAAFPKMITITCSQSIDSPLKVKQRKSSSILSQRTK